MQEIIIPQYSWIIVLISLWTLPWKGWALWKSARKKERVWFVALLVLNTLGILEILYIFFFSKQQSAIKQSNK